MVTAATSIFERPKGRKEKKMLRMEMIGNLTRDPESRTFQKGETDGKVCNFTVAVAVGYGQYKHTEFVRVAA